MALCGLVRDALEIQSDASPLLNKLAKELALSASGPLAEDLAEQPERVEALRRAGFIGH